MRYADTPKLVSRARRLASGSGIMQRQRPLAGRTGNPAKLSSNRLEGSTLSARLSLLAARFGLLLHPAAPGAPDQTVKFAASWVPPEASASRIGLSLETLDREGALLETQRFAGEISRFDLDVAV